MSNVSLQSGQLGLSVPLVEIAGIGGQKASVALQYSTDTLCHTVTHINGEAPTGIAGLGWSLHDVLIRRTPAGTGNPSDDTYYFAAGGSGFGIDLVGYEDAATASGTTRTFTFEARRNDHSKIRRVQEIVDDTIVSDRFTVVQVDGETMEFGGEVTGGPRHTCEGNAIEWMVTSNGWVGMTPNIDGQRQEPHIWHLRREIDIHGHAVTYDYTLFDDDVLPVGAPDGLPFTRTVYLTRVGTDPGQAAVLVYQPKDPTEYMPDWVVDDGGQRFVLRQSPCQTRCLGEVRFLDEHDRLLGTTVLEYASEPLNHADPEMAKRLLRSITHVGESGLQMEPATLFGYHGDADDPHADLYDVTKDTSDVFAPSDPVGRGGLFGAVRRMVDAEGAVTEYLFSPVSFDDGDSAALRRESDNIGPFVGSSPQEEMSALSTNAAVYACLTESSEGRWLDIQLWANPHGAWFLAWSWKGVVDHDKLAEIVQLQLSDTALAILADTTKFQSVHPPVIVYQTSADPADWHVAPFAQPPGVVLERQRDFPHGDDASWSLVLGRDFAAAYDPNAAVLHRYWVRSGRWTDDDEVHIEVPGDGAHTSCTGGTSYVAVACLWPDDSTRLTILHRRSSTWHTVETTIDSELHPDVHPDRIEVYGGSGYVACALRHTSDWNGHVAVVTTSWWADVDAPRHEYLGIFVAPKLKNLGKSSFDAYLLVCLPQGVVFSAVGLQPLGNVPGERGNRYVVLYDGTTWNNPAYRIKLELTDQPAAMQQFASTLSPALETRLLDQMEGTSRNIFFDIAWGADGSPIVRAEIPEMTHVNWTEIAEDIVNGILQLISVVPFSSLFGLVADVIDFLVQTGWSVAQSLIKVPAPRIALNDPGSHALVQGFIHQNLIHCYAPSPTAVASQHMRWERSNTVTLAGDRDPELRHTVVAQSDVGAVCYVDHLIDDVVIGGNITHFIPIANRRVRQPREIHVDLPADRDRVAQWGTNSLMFKYTDKEEVDGREESVRRFTLHQIDRFACEGAYHDYVVSRVLHHDGYQTYADNYEFTAFDATSLPAYSVANGHFAFNRVITYAGMVDDHLAAADGYTETYAYTGAGGALAPADPDAVSHPAVVAGQVYRTRRFAAGGVDEPLTETVSTVTVFEHDFGSGVGYTVRPKRQTSSVGSFTTEHEQQYDRATGLLIEETTFLDRGRVVAWPSYAYQHYPELAAAHILTPAVRHDTVLQGVETIHPSALVRFATPVRLDGDLGSYAVYVTSGGFGPADAYARVAYTDVEGNAATLRVADVAADGSLIRPPTSSADPVAPETTLHLLWKESDLTDGIFCYAVAIDGSDTVAVFGFAAEGEAFRTFGTSVPGGVLHDGVIADPNLQAMHYVANRRHVFQLTANFLGEYWSAPPGDEILVPPARRPDPTENLYVAARNPAVGVDQLHSLRNATTARVLDLPGRIVADLAGGGLLGSGTYVAALTRRDDAHHLVVVDEYDDMVSTPLPLVPAGGPVCPRGVIFVPGVDGDLAAYRYDRAAKALTMLWRGVDLPHGESTFAPAATDAQDNLYLPARGEQSGVVSVAPDGSVNWFYRAGADVLAPVVTPRGPATEPDHQLLATLRLGSEPALVAIADQAQEVTTIARADVSTWDVEQRLPVGRYTWQGYYPHESSFDRWDARCDDLPNWLNGGCTTVAAHGIPIETRDADGVTSAVVHDRDFLRHVATFHGASVAEGEAFYTGFEDYEVEHLALGSATRDGADSYTGASSLLVPAGGPEVHRAGACRPLARPPGHVVLAGYFQMSGDADSGEGEARISLALYDDATNEPDRRLEPAIVIGGTEGSWIYAEAVVDLRASTLVGKYLGPVIRNDSARPLRVDHLWYAPRDAAFGAAVYEGPHDLVTADIDESGHVTRKVHDNRHAPMVSFDASGRCVGFLAGFHSRDRGSDRFEPAQPNSAFTGTVRGASVHSRFRVDGDSEGWTLVGEATVADRHLQLRSAGGGRAAASFDYTEAHDEGIGVRVQLGPEWALHDTDSAALTLTCGDAAVSCVRQPDERSAAYTLTVGDIVAESTSPRIATDWMYVRLVDPQRGAVHYFFADGQMVFAEPQLEPISPVSASTIEFDLVGPPALTSSVRLRDVVMFSDPTLTASYADAQGHHRQTQAHETATTVVVTSEELFDPVGRPTFTTMSVRKHDSPLTVSTHALAFENHFVDDRDPADDGPLWRDDHRMNGLVQEWWRAEHAGNPAFRPDDFLYPYRGTFHQANPLDRVSETTGPQADFAVGSAHALTHSYEVDDNARALLAHKGRTADENFRGSATYPAIDDASRRTDMSIHDEQGRSFVAATGTTDHPFDTPDTFLANGSEYRYGADGSTHVISEYPNVFALADDPRRFDFRATASTDRTGRSHVGRHPDAGVTRSIADRAGRTLFSRDAVGASQGYFHYQSYDRHGRETDSGLIVGVPWHTGVLRAVSDLREAERRCGLVAAWPLDEGSGTTVRDTSGNEITGTLEGQPQWVHDAPNDLDESLAFSGPGGRGWVDFGAPGALQPAGPDLSVAVWLEITSDAADQIFLDAADGSGGNRIALALVSGRLRFELTVGGVASLVESQVRSSDLGRWLHLGATASNAELVLYRDGDPVAHATVHAPLPATEPVSWRLGAGRNGDYAHARISGVRAFTRTLGRPEFQALRLEGLARPTSWQEYDAAPGGPEGAARDQRGRLVRDVRRNAPVDPVDQVGLVARWRLDEGPGATHVVGTGSAGQVRAALSGATEWIPGSPLGGTALRLPHGGDDGAGATGLSVADLRARPGASMSVAAWVRIDDRNASGAILTYADPTTTVFFGLDEGRLAAARGDGAELVGVVGRPWSQRRRGAWTHVAATFSAGGAELYLDGEPLERLGSAVDPMPVPDGWVIAAGGNVMLADLRLYDRQIEPSLIRRLAVPPSMRSGPADVAEQRYLYDAEGRLIELTQLPDGDPAHGRVTRYAHDTVGQIVRIDYPTPIASEREPTDGSGRRDRAPEEAAGKGRS